MLQKPGSDTRLHYLQTFSDDFNFREKKKVSENKTVGIF